MGYRVPEDFAIIGFDNSIAGKTSHPRLTSVDQNIARLGESAVKLLFDQLNQIPCLTNPYLVDCDLVVRASCGCVETEETLGSSHGSLISKDELEHKFENNYEFNKFIMNYKFEVIKDLSWILAPFFQWGCLGLLE